MNAVAKKPEMDFGAVIDVNPTRLLTEDFGTYAPWLFARMREIRPDLNDRGIASWLSNLCASNECNLVKTRNAVGLAELTRRPMEHQVQIGVVFIFAKDERVESMSEAAALYRHFQKWGRGLGASVMDVNGVSDVPLELIERGCGKVKQRRVHYVDIVKE